MDSGGVDANTVVQVLKWVASVVTAVGVVMGALYKVVNAMVAKKIAAQLKVTVQELTAATSGQIESLREQMQEKHEQTEQARKDAEEKTERQLTGLTRRIDDLLSQLAARGIGRQN